MCGIAGYIGPSPLARDRIESCLSLMRRRGPDHADHKSFRTARGTHVHLLHSRLSIIDLDPRANQPYRRGSKWMVYNGELYNYLEVRKRLEDEGQGFATSSDTEVLLAALEHAGVGALDFCEGMWAFAVFDETDGSLLLGRDRFGEKPLVLARDGDGLYFASEVKDLAALRGRPFEVNENHLCRYLVHGYKALYKGQERFFRGIEDLPPATILSVDGEGRETRMRYWTPAFVPDSSMSYDAAVEGVRERLTSAMRLRLRADVPLAFCMSGGIDSNALISLAARRLGYDVHGFTIYSEDPRYDERPVVDPAVRELGIRHTYVPLETSGFLENLRTLVRYHDAPVYTITYYAHWQLLRNIAESGYRISVSGTAADELLSGYYDHHLAYLHAVRGDAELYARSRRNWEEKVKPHVRNPFLSDPELFDRDPAFRGHILLGAEEFSAALHAGWNEDYSEQDYGAELLRNRMLNELFHENVPVILHEDDLNAMYWSVENRSPYLDRALFDFCGRVPTRHLVKDGLAKALLRDAVRGTVPDVVLDNPRKVGFNASIHDLLDVKDPSVRAAVLDESPIYDLVKRPAVEVLLSRDHLPNSESKFLFYFLCAKLFLEESA